MSEQIKHDYEKLEKEAKKLQKKSDEQLSEEEFKLKHGLLTEADLNGGIPPCHY
ncbi:hypothetical protein HOD96_00210 [Candidatus Falkowbacteria bacterium]|jgi:hypothetical protein|nr:hypothetical protein [Candidatus Falkowbacteria bacterium]MBT4432834.1 hypothetical protein [Candidatus Falkowbacteria bacterium]